MESPILHFWNQCHCQLHRRNSLREDSLAELDRRRVRFSSDLALHCCDSRSRSKFDSVAGGDLHVICGAWHSERRIGGDSGETLEPGEPDDGNEQHSNIKMNFFFLLLLDSTPTENSSSNGNSASSKRSSLADSEVKRWEWEKVRVVGDDWIEDCVIEVSNKSNERDREKGSFENQIKCWSLF